MSAARAEILAELYGDRAAAIGAALDAVITAHRRDPGPNSTPVIGESGPPGGWRGRGDGRTRAVQLDALDETAAWVIAAPDHVSAPGEAPLATLDEFVRRHLEPQVTGVHTLPVHPSSSDGGFAVIDPAVVDPALGDWTDVDGLAAGRVWMADFVVNHLSAASPWFRRFLDGDPRFADFFLPLAEGADTTAVVRPRTSPIAHRYESVRGNDRIWTTFSADQVDLDYRNPAVLVAMVEVLARYVDHGARAVRLDAVAFLWKDPATPSIHLPQTHALVALLRLVLDDLAPDVLLVTETNVPHAENVSYFGTAVRPEADAVYQFALPPLVAYAALSGDTAPLVAWAGQLGRAPDGRCFLNFLASHDGIGLRPAESLLDGAALRVLTDATRAAGGVINRRSDGSVSRPYELAVSWFTLLATGRGEDEAIAAHLATHAVALALAGVPVLYLNSLFGVGNDTAAFATTRHGRDLNRRRHHAAELDAVLADASSRPARVWAGLREMLEARRHDPAFDPSSSQRILEGPPGTIVIERGGTTIVAVNLRATPTTVDLPGGGVELAPWQVRAWRATEHGPAYEQEWTDCWADGDEQVRAPTVDDGTK